MIEGLHRRYDGQVASASAELAHLKRSHEAKMAHELGQGKVQVDVAHDRVKASEAQAQLLLQEQEQRSAVLVSELRKALTAITEQDGANTRASAAMEVQLRKELLEAKHRIAQLEPAWEAFIERHNDEEEAQDLEQRRRAAVVAQLSELRSRRQGNESGRVELRGVTSMPSSDAASNSPLPATPRGRDADLSASHEPGSASTVGMFSPAASSGAESAGEPGPSTATVDSDAARVTEINRGTQNRHVQEAMPDSTVSSSVLPSSLVVALENIDLVPSEFFVSRYYETLEHQLSTIYRQFMLVYEDCRHEESTPQVKAMERAFKRSSEGKRLNNLIREKNVDGYLPRSVGEYMNAAEELAAEAEAALRKARRYTDAAGGKPSSSGAHARKRHQASTYKQKCPGCGSFDHVYADCYYRSHPYFNKDPSIEYAQSPVGI